MKCLGKWRSVGNCTGLCAWYQMTNNLNCLDSLSTQALVCFPVGIIAHHNLKTCSEAVLYTREVNPLRYDFYLDDQGKRSSNTLWWEQGSQECRRGSGFVGEAFAVNIPRQKNIWRVSQSINTSPGTPGCHQALPMPAQRPFCIEIRGLGWEQGAVMALPAADGPSCPCDHRVFFDSAVCQKSRREGPPLPSDPGFFPEHFPCVFSSSARYLGL